jgi:hypothetical protein
MSLWPSIFVCNTVLSVEGQTPSFEKERPPVIPAIFKPESSSFDMCKKNWIPAQEHRPE